MLSTKPGFIRTRMVSCFCAIDCECFQPRDFDLNMESNRSTPETAGQALEVGKWVLVQYDGDLFPGIITQVCFATYSEI